MFDNTNYRTFIFIQENGELLLRFQRNQLFYFKRIFTELVPMKLPARCK